MAREGLSQIIRLMIARTNRILIVRAFFVDDATLRLLKVWRPRTEASTCKNSAISGISWTAGITWAERSAIVFAICAVQPFRTVFDEQGENHSRDRSIRPNRNHLMKTYNQNIRGVAS